MKSLRKMTEEVYENNYAHGWFDKKRTFGDDIALLHSEVSEALDVYREIEFTECTDYGKPCDVASEFADVLIRLLDVTYRYGIDLEKQYERKMEYNRGRPYRHGGKNL